MACEQCPGMSDQQKSECNGGYGCCPFKQPDNKPYYDKPDHQARSTYHQPNHSKHKSDYQPDEEEE